MSNSRLSLELIDIASTCPAYWAGMPGDDRARFCQECRQHVYNLSEMTREEAENLIREKEGRLCVRLYRRSDGRVVTRDCESRRWARVRTRLAVVWGLLAGAVLGVVSWVVAAGDSGQRSSTRRGIRDIQPFKFVIDWIDPAPQVWMGAPCFPPTAPGNQTAPAVEVAPPPREKERPN